MLRSWLSSLRSVFCPCFCIFLLCVTCALTPVTQDVSAPHGLTPCLYDYAKTMGSGLAGRPPVFGFSSGSGKNWRRRWRTKSRDSGACSNKGCSNWMRASLESWGRLTQRGKLCNNDERKQILTCSRVNAFERTTLFREHHPQTVLNAVNLMYTIRIVLKISFWAWLVQVR